MKLPRTHRHTPRTPERLAEIRAVQERFRREKPSLEDLVQSGEYCPPISMGEYLDLQQILWLLRQERERQGMSLADVADRTGIDKSALSKLETGKQMNPTLDTLYRYAEALGKQIVCGLTDLSS